VREYDDIVTEDMSIGVPTTRSITHQISLMLRSSFGNKATHKMTPSKITKVNRQVQELLDRGFIKMSLAPYATPVVLASKNGGEWRMYTNS
jgi:hypothetical protein